MNILRLALVHLFFLKMRPIYSFCFTAPKICYHYHNSFYYTIQTFRMRAHIPAHALTLGPPLAMDCTYILFFLWNLSRLETQLLAR